MYFDNGKCNDGPESDHHDKNNEKHIIVRSSGIHLSETSPTSFRETAAVENGDKEELIQVTPIRKTIAMRTFQSLREIPHSLNTIETDVTNLVVLRAKLKDEFMDEEGVNLTYLPFFIKAVVSAIVRYPLINSVWGVDKIIIKRDINISLLIGTEDSVFAPVIKHADKKSIAEIALEIDRLTKKARSGQLKFNDIQEGTFTINNTGAFGSILSYPTINYPQAAILTFEAILKRPRVVNDMIAVRSVVNMCISSDIRIMDPHIVGGFLRCVKENLENYDIYTTIY